MNTELLQNILNINNAGKISYYDHKNNFSSFSTKRIPGTKVPPLNKLLEIPPAKRSKFHSVFPVGPNQPYVLKTDDILSNGIVDLGNLGICSTVSTNAIVMSPEQTKPGEIILRRQRLAIDKYRYVYEPDYTTQFTYVTNVNKDVFNNIYPQGNYDQPWITSHSANPMYGCVTSLDCLLEDIFGHERFHESNLHTIKEEQFNWQKWRNNDCDMNLYGIDNCQDSGKESMLSLSEPNSETRAHFGSILLDFYDGWRNNNHWDNPNLLPNNWDPVDLFASSFVPFGIYLANVRSYKSTMYQRECPILVDVNTHGNSILAAKKCKAYNTDTVLKNYNKECFGLRFRESMYFDLDRDAYKGEEFLMYLVVVRLDFTALGILVIKCKDTTQHVSSQIKKLFPRSYYKHLQIQSSLSERLDKENVITWQKEYGLGTFSTFAAVICLGRVPQLPRNTDTPFKYIYDEEKGTMFYQTLHFITNIDIDWFKVV